MCKCSFFFVFCKQIGFFYCETRKISILFDIIMEFNKFALITLS